MKALLNQLRRRDFLRTAIGTAAATAAPIAIAATPDLASMNAEQLEAEIDRQIREWLPYVVRTGLDTFEEQKDDEGEVIVEKVDGRPGALTFIGQRAFLMLSDAS